MSDPLLPHSQGHSVSPPEDIPEDLPHANPAGVVSHQDQFSTPQENMVPASLPPGGLSNLLRRPPSPPANKPRPQTVLASSIGGGRWCRKADAKRPTSIGSVAKQSLHQHAGSNTGDRQQGSRILRGVVVTTRYEIRTLIYIIATKNEHTSF